MLTVAGVFSWSSTGVPAAVTDNRAIGIGGEEERAWETLVDHPWPVKKQEMIPMLGSTEMMPLIKPTLD